MTFGAANQMAGAGAMWGLADYPGLADRLAPAATLLADLVQPGGPRVLDLAAGTGNVAVRAARRGAAVTAADLSPRMVELGRARTAGLDVGWQVADAGDLPFENSAFDAVLSAFGIIFAPVPAAALAQARRVLASGRLLALTSWTPGGFMGHMTEVMRRWLPPAQDAADVLDWGRPPTLTPLLAATGFGPPLITTHTLPWHFDSPGAMTEFLLAHSPTHRAAADALGSRANAMFAAVEALAGSAGEPVRVDAEYLLVTATAR
jgi:SAM-dependent methyltransferase